jgi:hypothetical protein
MASPIEHTDGKDMKVVMVIVAFGFPRLAMPGFLKFDPYRAWCTDIGRTYILALDLVVGVMKGVPSDAYHEIWLVVLVQPVYLKESRFLQSTQIPVQMQLGQLALGIDN